MNSVPLDVIGENICKYLSFRDMGRAMQCNNEWMKIFIFDPCYVHYKRKALKNHPNLQKIFDRYPWPFHKRNSELRPSKAKKRRKVWIIPRGGTRYVFKNWIRAVYDFRRFKDILYRKSDQDLRNTLLEEWLRDCFNFLFTDPQINIKFIKLEESVFYFECNGSILKMQEQNYSSIWLGGFGICLAYINLHQIQGELYQIFKKRTILDPAVEFRFSLKRYLKND